MKTYYGVNLAILGTLLAICPLARSQDQVVAQPSDPASAPAATAATEGTPRLELSSRVFNFGEVWFGMPAKGDFTVKNLGDAPLTLSLKSSCGCTVATRPKSPLPAGESCTFSITYSTTRAGQANKTVTLTTNDPEQAKVVIPVMGKVTRLFELTPGERFTFRDLESESRVSQTIKMASNYGKPVHLKLKDGQDLGRFSADLKEVTPGRVYELTASTVPPLEKGSNRATITLETGLEELPALTVSVMGHVRARVAVVPMKLYAGPYVAPSRPMTVRLRYRADQPVTITGVKASLTSIKCEILPPGKRLAGQTMVEQEIRVALPTYAELPDEGALLEIFTDDKSPEYARLEVPILKRKTAARRHPGVAPDENHDSTPVEPKTAKQRIEEALRRAKAGEGPSKSDDASAQGSSEEKGEGGDK